MCMRTHMTDSVGFMSLDTFHSIFKDFTPRSIKLNWRGEPLLHKQLIEMVAYAKNRGVVDVSLNTNGLLLNEEIIEGLCDAGLNWIIISVDGATKYTYESIRKGGDFGRLFQNILLVNTICNNRKRRPSIRLQICEQPRNSEEIEEWRVLFRRYADQLRIGNIFDPQGKYGFRSEIPKFCTSPWQRLTIAWNGNIHICPAEYLSSGLGNINTDSIWSVWHSNAMADIRKKIKASGRSSVKPCMNCSSYC